MSPGQKIGFNIRNFPQNSICILKKRYQKQHYRTNEEIVKVITVCPTHSFHCESEYTCRQKVLCSHNDFCMVLCFHIYMQNRLCKVLMYSKYVKFNKKSISVIVTSTVVATETNEFKI